MEKIEYAKGYIVAPFYFVIVILTCSFSFGGFVTAIMYDQIVENKEVLSSTNNAVDYYDLNEKW